MSSVKPDPFLATMADINRGACYAKKAYPGSYFDTTDPSMPRMWQFVDSRESGLMGIGNWLVLRMTGADTSQPRYFWGRLMPMPDEAAQRGPVRIHPNKFSQN